MELREVAEQILPMLRDELDDADRRLRFRVPQHLWLPRFTEVSFEQQMLADYGMPPSLESQAGDEYAEEVAAIQRIITERSITIPNLWPWPRAQSDSVIVSATNCQAAAMQIWGLVAKPIRRTGSGFSVVIPPQDLFGQPVVQGTLPDPLLEWFLQVADDSLCEHGEVDRRLRVWKRLALSMGTLAVVLLLVILL